MTQNVEVIGHFDKQTMKAIENFKQEKGWSHINTRGLYQMMKNEEISIVIGDQLVAPTLDGFYVAVIEDDELVIYEDERLDFKRIIIQQDITCITFTQKYDRVRRKKYMEVA